MCIVGFGGNCWWRFREEERLFGYAQSDRKIKNQVAFGENLGDFFRFSENLFYEKQLPSYPIQTY